VQNGHIHGLIWTKLSAIFTKPVFSKQQNIKLIYRVLFPIQYAKTMKHLTVLVPEGQINLSSVIGSFKIFNRANEYWQNLGRQPVLKVQLAGFVDEVKLYGGLFSIHPSKIGQIKKSDLVIIPSINKDYDNSIRKNRELIFWIKEQYQKGAEIASICTGAFLLASTGLVNGKHCSTHWIAADVFRKMFPEVKLVTEKIITHENGIYTNGGAFSFLNLILYLVEQYFDRQTAIYCSKVFQIDIDRNTQSPFTIFAGQKEHQDDLIQKTQALLETHLQEKISFEQLASEMAISRRNFDRRFIKATGNTPVEYLQRVKIEAAKKQLETGRKTVNEVMYDVGYSDEKAFREVFRKITGLSPLEYRNRYNKGAVFH
jgi:transcriptional regulator GlxA family with amidase domain